MSVSLKVSRALLTVEMAVLALPTILGVVVCASLPIGFIEGELPLIAALPSAFALALLGVGLVLVASFASGGARKARELGRGLWVSAAVGAATSATAFALMILAAECWLRREPAGIAAAA